MDCASCSSELSCAALGQIFVIHKDGYQDLKGYLSSNEEPWMIANGERDGECDSGSQVHGDA